MISEKVKQQLREGLRAFQTPIRVSGHFTPSDFQEYVEQDKACALFIGSCSFVPSLVWGGVSTRLDICYVNREYSYDDVHLVTNIAAVNSAICHAVGNYKPRMAFIAPRTLPVASIISKFLQRFGTFYANYMGYSTGSTTSPLCSHPIFLMEHNYRIDRATLTTMENEVKQEINRLASMLFLPRMPDVAKVYLAHNYLATTVKYVLKEGESPLELSYQQSAYGALIRKKCVCQGYAEAFKRLMDVAGVPCEVVCGQVIGMPDYHAWNIVRLNGGSDGYHLDVTWDISDGAPNYTYYGKNDAFFKDKRIWDKGSYFLCYKTTDIKSQAQTYIRMNKDALQRKGIPSVILDV